MKKIKPDAFYFISKNYFTVRYNLLTLRLDKKNNTTLHKETKQLIARSKFNVFLSH